MRLYQIVFGLLLLVQLPIYGQDTLFLKKNDVIVGWIQEVNSKYVTIRLSDEEESPLLKFKKNKIKKIRYREGKVINEISKIKTELSSNKSNQLLEKKLGLYVGAATNSVFEVPQFNLSMDYFVGKGLDMEFNFNIANEYWSDYSFGLLYYFLASKRSKFKPFAGMQVGYFSRDIYFLAPVGVSYFRKKSFSAKFRINPGLYNAHDYDIEKNNYSNTYHLKGNKFESVIGVQFSFGWRF